MVRAPIQLSRSIQSNLVTLEDQLAALLTPFIDKMIRFGLPAESFQLNEKIQFSIYGIIRKKVQEAYIIGLDAVEELIKKRIPTFELFMSVNDIQTIKDITATAVQSFWVSTTKLLDRENQRRQKKITNEDKKSFDKEAAIKTYSAFVIYLSYNNAIDSKLTNILPLPKKGGEGERSASIFTDFDPLTNTVDEGFGELSILDNLQELLDEMMEMFLTKEDQDVDPAYCEPLNRAVFPIDDPDKPDPPLHPNCRCILVPVKKEVSAFFAG
jgi:hypothetical protein